MSPPATQSPDLTERSLRATVVGAVGAVLAIVAPVFVVVAVNIGDLGRAEQQARRSDEIRLLAAASERSLVDMETGLRGFLLTREHRFLQPYVQAKATLGSHLTRLQALTADDSMQRLRMRGLAHAIASYQASYASPLAPGVGWLTPAQAAALTSHGKRLLDAIRARFKAFDGAEESRSARQHDAAASRVPKPESTARPYEGARLALLAAFLGLGRPV